MDLQQDLYVTMEKNINGYVINVELFFLNEKRKIAYHHRSAYKGIGEQNGKECPVCKDAKDVY